MKKKVIVLSLGGSLIVPEKININYLEKFRKVILKNSKKYKFVIVCGGGSVARIYISALAKFGISDKLQSYAGISATRMNARFVNYLFVQDSEKGIPHTLREIKKNLRKQDVVVSGALDYKPKQTSDSTAAEIASKFKGIFINLTNVRGIYDKNPKKFKNAKFISKITWSDFYQRANKIEFKPGQHFVLDQTATKIIMEKKIKTYILGKDLQQLENVLKNKKFSGSLIEG